MKIATILKFLETQKIEYEYKGSRDIDITGYSSLKNYKNETITWIGRRELLNKFANKFDILIAIVEKGLPAENINSIIVSNSKTVFFLLIDHFFEGKKEIPPIGHGCYIGKNVCIGKNVRIGNLCVLDGDIEIGDDTVIYNNVNIIMRIKGKN